MSDFSPSDAPVQLTVFDDEEKLRKLEHLDRAVDNIRPVSYTHLDVYKRQQLNHGTNISVNFKPATGRF